MNSNTQIQNTINHPPLQPYVPNLNQSTQQIEVGTRHKRDRPNKQPRKTKAEPYRVCRRVNILRDYPDDKTKLYPRN